VRLPRRAGHAARNVGSGQPTADASFTGAFFGVGNFASDFGNSTTLPATMLDGDTSTFWSNRYSKVRTQTLPDVTNAHPRDWVSVTWPSAQRLSEIDALFITDANDQLPASIKVSYWDGQAWVPVGNQSVTFATASNAPTAITFSPVNTTQLKLDMTSASPNDPVTGNLAISELKFPGVGGG
jgi:beta-galactosidase